VRVLNSGEQRKRNWNRLNWIIHFDNFCTQIGSFFGLMAFTLSSLCQPVLFSFHPLVSSFFSSLRKKWCWTIDAMWALYDLSFIYESWGRKKAFLSFSDANPLRHHHHHYFCALFFAIWFLFFCCLAKYKIWKWKNVWREILRQLKLPINKVYNIHKTWFENCNYCKLSSQLTCD
jgi:hypothetical protein